MNQTDRERDWPEDFEQENGNYQNKCRECGNIFMGNKHRFICKLCATPDWIELAKKQPPEDCKNNQAWHGAWLEGEMVGFARCMVNKVIPADKQLEELRAELEGMRSLQAQTKRDFLKENAELKAELEKTKLEHANTIQRLEAAKSMIILNTRL